MMGRYGVDEEQAFQLIRDQARASNSMLADTAQLVVDGELFNDAL